MARSFAPPAAERGETSLLACAAAAIAALTLWRVGMLLLDATELSTDEAQYWLWSQAPSWGEYSKPPLIGWLIWLSKALFGETIPAVRLPAPLLHGATALILMDLGHRMGGPRIGAVAALSYATMPAVTLGSALMTTDTPMLFFLAVALNLQHRLARQAEPLQTLGLGLAVGLGVLSKHAMIYGLAGMMLAAAVTAAWRPGWRVVGMAGAVALLVTLPHLLWLWNSGFVTLRHLASSGASEGIGLNLPGALRFLAEQFAVMGPILFAAFWLGLTERSQRGTAVIALTVLGIVTAQALFSHALANWAVGFTLPGCLVAAQWLSGRRRVLAASLAFGLAVAVALPLVTAFGTGWRLGEDRLALARYLGHDVFAAPVLEAAKQAGAGAIIADGRDMLAALSWAARKDGPEVLARPDPGPARHHWDLKAPLPDPAPWPVLLVYEPANPPPACGDILRPPRPEGPGFLQGHQIGLALLPEGCR
ncbi:glycosyltransferase family 39 protein [Paracoccus aerodenitrificans]|uniref:glycosyltransferase family 39 protein n=1 Tax=Paracoccus aerodenitrificans TaxID=3017781 RepID=UPI0022F04AB0|nr:glycosyltransferase family 39 protein [Paracoccus aerodenitrificans]WBU63448.1 glycosyltransferase family 39 protein [Paracoccus aerodenitrificans]